MDPRLALRSCAAGLFFASSSLSIAAAAPDIWVDPVSGSNSNTGASSTVPLQTISEATGRVAAGETVYLLPGTYAESTGEAFPIQIPAGVRVASTEGLLATTIDARGAGTFATSVFECGPDFELAGLTVQRSDRHHLAFTPDASPSVQRIENVAFVGGESVILVGLGSFEFEGCTMRGQTGASVSVLTESELDSLDLQFTHCDFEASRSAIEAWFEATASANIELDRCRLVDQARPAINSTNAGYDIPRFSLRNCLLARNVTGIKLFDQASLVYTTLVVEHCTIVDSLNHGLDLKETTPPESVVRNSVIARSGLNDMLVESYGIPIPMRRSLVEDGGYGLPPNTITGDPGFVAPQSGDYSLRSDSRCLDWGLASSAGIGSDLAGRGRSVDGNLDLLPAPDLGALEHAPLLGPDVIHPGQPAQLGLSGPAGGFSTLILAPGGYAPFGNTTPFGRLFVDPNGAFRATPVMTTGGAPTWVDISALVDPSWIGTSIGFQALPRSFAAPAGGAYSNPLLIPIE